MAFDHVLIITAFIFLVIMRIAVWIIAHHRLQNLVFVGIYLIAIAPNLVRVLSGPILFDTLIMAFFDSIWIYILFSIYLVALIVMVVIDKGWLARHMARPRPPEVPVPLDTGMLQQIKEDLQELE